MLMLVLVLLLLLLVWLLLLLLLLLLLCVNTFAGVVVGCRVRVVGDVTYTLRRVLWHDLALL